MTTVTGPPVLAPEEMAAYLERLGVDEQDATAPPDQLLERLHVSHLLHVPFENIDLHLREPIQLDVAALFAKLVDRRRGGYCYELNGLFASLLVSLGFDVTMVSSQVWMPDGELTPPFDHHALLVEVAGETWLADVGFGDAFLTPRPLGSQWTEASRRLRTVETGAGWQLERDEGDGWTPMYLLDLRPRALAEFLPRSRWHETSPDSPFQRRVFASRATARGRVTVADTSLIVTEDGERVEQALPEGEGGHAVLLAHFSPSVVGAFQAVRPAPAAGTAT